MKSLLEQSGIQESNLGSCLGPDGWLPNNDGNLIVSANLTSSPDIASVEADSTKSYERVLSVKHKTQSLIGGKLRHQAVINWYVT